MTRMKEDRRKGLPVPDVLNLGSVPGVLLSVSREALESQDSRLEFATFIPTVTAQRGSLDRIVIVNHVTVSNRARLDNLSFCTAQFYWT